MSRREWERGTIIIPTGEWAKFKKALREAYNKGVELDYAQALRVHAQVKLDQKGKRGVDWGRVIHLELEKHTSAIKRSIYGEQHESSPVYPLTVTNSWGLRQAMVSKKTADGVEKLTLAQPRKSDACFAPAKSTTMSYNLVDAEASITLNDKARSVEWEVGESNHACEQARASYLGVVLFDLLKGIAYTRGTGGTIYGGDEYADDASRESRGSSSQYDKDYFGPKVEGARRFLRR